MNTFRFLLVVASLCLSQNIQAQWRLLYHSKDVTTEKMVAEEPDMASQIQSIESRGSLSKYLVVRFSNHQKSLVLKKDVWGYVDDNYRIWRSCDKEMYLVTRYNNGGWVEYVANRLTTGGRIYPQVMYSRTLDSQISTVWLQAMSDVPPMYIVR